MINYTITRTQDTTKITLPEGTIKYHNKLNNTSYYTNKAEQRIRTHKRSWKTVATVYLDNITLDTETITDDTVFTFHLKNTTNNTSIDIPVNNKLADFQTNITNKLNPKHFYIVDLDNTSRFQTHFLDFINTVLIELNTNSVVLNELIEDTPVEEPEPVTGEINWQTLTGIPQNTTGNIENIETDDEIQVKPRFINKTLKEDSVEYIILWEKDDHTLLQPDDLFEDLTSLYVDAEINNQSLDGTITQLEDTGTYKVTISFDSTTMGTPSNTPITIKLWNDIDATETNTTT